MQKVKTNKTKKEIIVVANKLFQRFGFAKTSMDEIAQAAHKAKRSIYNHFADKEDLFCTVAEDELLELRNKLTPIFLNQQNSPLLRLKEYLLARFQVIAESGIYHLVLEHASTQRLEIRFGNIQKSVDEFEKWEHKILVSLCTDKDASILTDTTFNADAFADMVQMLLKSLDYSFFIQKKYKEFKETYILLINLIINSLNNQQTINTIHIQ